jgi:magnesium transporter
LYELQLLLNEVRQFTQPLKSVLASIVSGEFNLIQGEACVYFRDLLDHQTRVIENIERLMGYLRAVREHSLAMAAHKTNDSMRRLTMFSVIFLPLGFITGFFGMNFEQLPFKNESLFVSVLLLIVLCPIVILWFMKGVDSRK